MWYKGGSDQTESREIIVVPIAEVAYADLRGRSAKRNTSIGRLSTDLLALATGHLELVREFDLEMLYLPAVLAQVGIARVAHPCTCTRIRTEVCLAERVYADICEYAEKHACDAGQVAADLLAIVTGHPDAVRHLDRESQLGVPVKESTRETVMCGATQRCPPAAAETVRARGHREAEPIQSVVGRGDQTTLIQTSAVKPLL